MARPKGTGYQPIMSEESSDKESYRVKQRQAGTGTGMVGICSKDRQGQAGPGKDNLGQEIFLVPACPFLVLLIPVCPC